MSATVTDAEAAAAAVPEGWHVLVVDDEQDVHDATRLAVKRKTWRKRPFVLHGVKSAKAARDLLADSEIRQKIQVAIVDVVMETRFAGLDLCRFIRAELPRSVRIILRTGQPGVAPEEKIINDYDIDFYFAKTEATAERLYMALRACLRSSQDIETLLAFGNQLRSFTTALQQMTSREDLQRFMRVGLDFLELKHQAQITFISDVDRDPGSPAGKAVGKALSLELESGKLHNAAELGLEDMDPKTSVLVFTAPIEGSTPKRGGFVVNALPSTQHSLQNDLVLFMQNWTAALSSLLAQSRSAQVGRLTELSYVDRIGGITTILTGAADRIQTAVGGASAAAHRLTTLAGELSGVHAARLREGIEKVDSDLATATNLITTFERVSSTQLRDERVALDLVPFVRGCLDLLPRAEGYTINVTSSAPQLMWTGYPGALAQVVLKLVQGALRHAYEDESGKIDVRLLEAKDGFAIEVEDYGRGFPLELIKRKDDPLDMSVPTTVGLKLAVAQNIVGERLAGRLECKSAPDEGTKFTVHLPLEVPEEPLSRP